MMRSSTGTLSSPPKSTTTRPKIRCSLVAERWKESRLVPLLDADLGYKTSSKTMEVTSSCTLVFLSFPFFVFSLPFSPFSAFSLALSSCFFFPSTTFKQVFSKASLTFLAFSLSYAMRISRVLSSKLAKASSLATIPPIAFKELNCSFSKAGTCWGPHSRYQATPRRWIEVQVHSCN